MSRRTSSVTGSGRLHVPLEKGRKTDSGARNGYQTYNAALRGGSGGTFARCRKLPILTQFAPLTGGKWVVFLEIRDYGLRGEPPASMSRASGKQLRDAASVSFEHISGLGQPRQVCGTNQGASQSDRK
ncbi:hypothetical protein Poly51_59330 [Rubripirellula tenax]|uniref:Uncharacterized protein n=1 Tax=Rubripirellula tenax TaxID=2528015 RepID=A0A5C6E805_9BACT|nr:hypothetical protein Poly51_59330 [Rubripirellula tenax]